MQMRVISEATLYHHELNLLTPRVKPWVIHSFLTFEDLKV